MLPIRSRTFESSDSADVAISRLDWKVEKVKKLTNPLLNHATADTAKPWVGRIDMIKREFEITQTAPYFAPRITEGNFFQLPIRGQIVACEQKSKIILTFRLALTPLLFFILIYLFPILATISYIRYDSGNWSGLLFSLAVPTLLTLLLIWQLNRTENKLIDLFGVR